MAMKIFSIAAALKYAQLNSSRWACRFKAHLYNIQNLFKGFQKKIQPE
jgi:hypothetical protein